jgi:hypothetical protein
MIDTSNMSAIFHAKKIPKTPRHMQSLSKHPTIDDSDKKFYNIMYDRYLARASQICLKSYFIQNFKRIYDQNILPYLNDCSDVLTIKNCPHKKCNGAMMFDIDTINEKLFMGMFLRDYDKCNFDTRLRWTLTWPIEWISYERQPYNFDDSKTVFHIDPELFNISQHMNTVKLPQINTVYQEILDYQNIDTVEQSQTLKSQNIERQQAKLARKRNGRKRNGRKHN